MAIFLCLKHFWQRHYNPTQRLMYIRKVAPCPGSQLLTRRSTSVASAQSESQSNISGLLTTRWNITHAKIIQCSPNSKALREKGMITNLFITASRLVASWSDGWSPRCRCPFQLSTLNSHLVHGDDYDDHDDVSDDAVVAICWCS